MKVDIHALNGISVIPGKIFSDTRGNLQKLDFPDEVVFHSMLVSKNLLSGTVRGMHMQLAPFGEHKLVTCIDGEIVDYILDLRRNSETFGNWASIRLPAPRADSILIPPGFAHGFQTQVHNSTVLYSVSGEFNSDSSLTLNIRDPRLGIELLQPVSVISSRDENGISFQQYVNMDNQ